MENCFKIYYNDSFVLISDKEQNNVKFDRVIKDGAETKAFFSNSLQLFDGGTNENILIVSNKPDVIFLNFANKLTKVIAGGGIVTNEKDELLMIFRRGKWDMPKGKIESGEKISEGAVREVEEETGVIIEHINDSPILTYHAYNLKGKNSLKETSWFEMKAKPSQNRLTPQLEEDIEDVRWVKKSDLMKYKKGCYLLIWDLISGYAH